MSTCTDCGEILVDGCCLRCDWEDPETFIAMQSSGLLLDDRYELVEFLGEGGMGQVWRAYDQWTTKTVAVKLLTRDTRECSVATQKLRQEYQAMSQLSHPNVIRVHDFGQCQIPDLESGGLLNSDYFTMEFVVPPTLTIADLVQEGPMVEQSVVHMGIGLAKAVIAVHDSGILHGDIKPANIFAIERGNHYHTLLADLSACIVLGATDNNVHAGTPSYMSREFLDAVLETKGAPLSKGADIWAVGTVLYEMVSGEPLFPIPDSEISALSIATHIRSQISDGAFIPTLHKLQPEEGGLTKLIEKCLHVDQSERIDGPSLLQGLEELLRSTTKTEF